MLAKHELSVQVGHFLVFWELKPHSSDQGESLRRSLVEHRVDVVDQVVAKVNSVPDHGLNPLILEPRFPVLVINLVVGSEERIEHAELVHHDPEVLGRVKLVAWNVSSTEGMPSNTH